MSAPIKHTCPDIDKALRHIKNAWDEIKGYVDDKSGLNSIEWELDMAKEIMEELRNSNDALRSWGYDLEKELKETQDNEYDAQQSLEAANKQIALLEKEISGYVQEIKDLDKILNTSL